MKKIYIAVLSMGYIRRELAPVLCMMKNDPRFKVTIETHALRPASHNRNNSVREFLKTDCDYFLTIDHDNVPLNNPLDLVLADRDVIGCPYPTVKGNDIGFLAMRRVENGEYLQAKVSGGLQEVDAVGSGVMLVARRVLEKVIIPFERDWDNGFAVKGLDFYFCEKAKKLGFSIWTHWGYQASHYKELDMLHILRIAGKIGERIANS